MTDQSGKDELNEQPPADAEGEESHAQVVAACVEGFAHAAHSKGERVLLLDAARLILEQDRQLAAARQDRAMVLAFVAATRRLDKAIDWEVQLLNEEDSAMVAIEKARDDIQSAQEALFILAQTADAIDHGEVE